MRWRLTLLVAAATSAVVLAFLIPLALLLRSLAAERTIANATQEAQAVAATAATGGSEAVANQLRQPDPDRIGRITVYFTRVQDTVGAEPQARPADLNQRARTDRENGEAIVWAPAVGGTGGATLVRVRVTPGELHAGVGRATLILAGLGALMLLLAAVAADALGRRVSRPIRDLAIAAGSLHEGRLETRVPERGPPEVIAMSRALNRLAARIEQLLIAERESVADLSHRLRTPITALRLDADAITEPELAERLGNHVAQLERTVDAVVKDARRPVRSNVAPRCDVAAVVDERVTFWSALADEQGRQLRSRIPAWPAYARIDAVELTDVVDVLIDNVFAHTEEGVPLEVSVNEAANREVVLTVQDGGPGLPGADVVARGKSNAGSSGLGLDIVRRATISTGGRLELGRSRLGGAQVRVVLGPAERSDQTGDWLRRPRRKRLRSRLRLWSTKPSEAA